MPDVSVIVFPMVYDAEARINRRIGIGAHGGSNPPPDLSASGATPNIGYVDVLFSGTLDPLFGQAAEAQYWTFTGGTVSVVATSVQLMGSTVRVFHTEPKAGESLTIHLPLSGLLGSNGAQYAGPAQFGFTSVALPPTAIMATALNGTSVRVIFSEPVLTDEAVDPSNYSISPTLAVLAVSQESASTYVLTTAPQNPGTSYTITVVNVRDYSQNPV